MKHTRISHLETALTICAGMLLLFFITHKLIFCIIALSVAVLAIAWKKGIELLHIGWMKLAEILGKINGTILLTLVFFIFLTPISLLARLFGNKHLGLTKKTDASYWYSSEKKYTPKDLLFPW